MSDRTDIETEPPSIAARLTAYSMVVVMPVLAFFVLANFGYGSGTIRLEGVQDLMETPTNEELGVPNFSLLARLVHGYAASPGYGMTQRRFDEFEALSTPVDVVVFGSSHAYRGFDPRVFARHDVQLFNLGSTGQTPIATRFLVDDLGDDLQAKLAIIEVTPFQLQSGAESALSVRDLALNRPRSWSAMRMALQTRDFDTTRLVASYMVAPRPHLEEIEGGVPLDIATFCHYVPGGYCEWGSTGQDHQQFPSFDFAPSPDALVYLSDVVTKLRERGIDVVFVIAPIPEPTARAARNLESGLATLTQFAEALDVPLFNWQQRLPLTHPQHFYDGDHMNQAGVTIFNEALVTELDRRGLLGAR